MLKKLIAATGLALLISSPSLAQGSNTSNAVMTEPQVQTQGEAQAAAKKI